jgi:NAD(P)H-hydrate epimerase
MELAGSSAASVAYDMLVDRSGEALVVCGNGNNGGDGLVIARFLHVWDLPVKVWLVDKKGASEKGKQKMISPEANTNLEIAGNIGVPLHFFDDPEKPSFENAALIIDALLGTGLDRPVEGIYKQVIERINNSGKAVLAVDLPSGVNSDTGQVMGAAVRAVQTVTFGYLKTGLLCHPAAELCGKLNLVDIGLPSLGERSPKVSLTTVEHVRELLPVRTADSNKGTYGTLLTVAGSLGMSGATMLSTESALRVGCGLSILATPKSLVANLPPQEVIYKALPETERISIHPDAIADLTEELKRASAVVLGPGMSTHPATVEFVLNFVEKTLSGAQAPPCLIDADALNAISKRPACLAAKHHSFVLTPHPKELSRLTGIPTDQIQADRVSSAVNAAKRFASVVLLKGANTVIADPSGTVFINPTGGPAMAKAGAGDVLSGIIGGLLAQGLAPLDAAVAGAYIHGRAGDLASQIHGLAGVMAGEISINIPDALRTILDGTPSALEESLEETVTIFR